MRKLVKQKLVQPETVKFDPIGTVKFLVALGTVKFIVALGTVKLLVALGTVKRKLGTLGQECY